MQEFLKLKKSNCKNCYKCIRSCPVKSIRFSAGQANIVSNECILCGQCFVVCPQNAKEIVSEMETVKMLLADTVPVVASIAPSFVANYDNATIEEMEVALKKLGFAAVEETAIGAKLVKDEYERILMEENRDVVISSCCQSVNLLIEKYYPDLLSDLADVITPMQAHCLDIKKRMPGARTVFIGPCVAKKEEASRHRDTVDAVLTFEELSNWLVEKKEKIPAGNQKAAYMKRNEKGRTRLFPTTGGILKSMDCIQPEYEYLSVDGIVNCMNALEDIRSGKVHHCFIEMSACTGSCIGGPVMEKYHKSPVQDYLSVVAYAGHRDFETVSLSREQIHQKMNYIDMKLPYPNEQEIREILERMGKHTKEDELNCGTCGYNSCRDKAIAIFRGKAELSMCLPFLKEKAESFSDNILENTPNGIIVLNEKLEVQRINQSAMSILNIRTASDVLGEQIIRIMDPADYITVREKGESITNRRVFLAEYKRYVEETIVFDMSYRILICILRDVTEEEAERKKKEDISMQTVEIADRVVDKQMRIVQEIASLLGETAAETKIALTKLKESIHDE